MTHTYAELEVSEATYNEIAGKLKKADYDQAFMGEGVIDMHGIALKREKHTCSACGGRYNPMFPHEKCYREK